MAATLCEAAKGGDACSVKELLDGGADTAMPGFAELNGLTAHLRMGKKLTAARSREDLLEEIRVLRERLGLYPGDVEGEGTAGQADNALLMESAAKRKYFDVKDAFQRLQDEVALLNSNHADRCDLEYQLSFVNLIGAWST